MAVQKLEKELENNLNQQMQEGYRYAMEGNSNEAVDAWLVLWQNILGAMETHHIEYIEDMDHAFHGQQSIYNWSMDFEMELSNVIREDKSFIQTKIDFCTDYITKSKDKSETNILVLKREAAECYFRLGKAAEGEELFQKYVEDHPTSGWGWINWSDQYGFFAEKENKDYDRAIAILKQGLEVENLEDRRDVLDRLNEYYEEMGMAEQSAALKRHMSVQQEKNNAPFWKNDSSIAATVIPVTSEKVGRNDPCPCGSGKKYKKCCGKN